MSIIDLKPQGGTHPSTLRSIISFGEDDIVVKFHVERAGESYLADDLDGYDQDGVCEACSADFAFFELFQ